MATTKQIALKESEDLRKLLLKDGVALSEEQWPSNIPELRNKVPFTKIVLVYKEYDEDAQDWVFQYREMNDDEDFLFANLVKSFVGYFSLPLDYATR